MSGLNQVKLLDRELLVLFCESGLLLLELLFLNVFFLLVVVIVIGVLVLFLVLFSVFGCVGVPFVSQYEGIMIMLFLIHGGGIKIPNINNRVLLLVSFSDGSIA